MASGSWPNRWSPFSRDTFWNNREYDMCIYEIDQAISSLPPSARELFRRRREIHDNANRWLFETHAGGILGRDDSLLHTDDLVYVVDHEGVLDRHGDVRDEYPKPLQRIDYFYGICREVVFVRMCHREWVIPTHRLLSPTGCFVVGMIKVQRQFRYKRVLRMLGTFRLLPSSLQHYVELRDLVARFLCGRPKFVFRYSANFPRIFPGPQRTSMGWRALYD
jgi:hypothetical protein